MRLGTASGELGHIGAGILGVPSSQAFGDGEAARVWVLAAMWVAGEAPCSIGVTEWAPGEELDALLGREDRALYEAKRSGQGRIVFQDRLQAS